LIWANREIIYLRDSENPNLIVANFDDEKFLCNSEEKRMIYKD
jgi:hypothetical protein